MFNNGLIEKLQNVKTPFYYYDVNILSDTLKKINGEAEKYGYIVHYALKANSNHKLLKIIKDAGLGSDCVSGNEVQRSIDCGFEGKDIAFAGVGKTDQEIITALNNDIFCFNCESTQEIQVINAIAQKMNKTANIALRINPNVDAHTHQYITTGLEENKFGISAWEFEKVLDTVKSLKNINLIGLHFHIGSQITDFDVFKNLCRKVNEIQDWFAKQDVYFKIVNVGGGLGVDYSDPDDASKPDFAEYFSIFHKFLELRKGQELHFELGRSVVAQCASLLTKVLYVKEGINTNFAILDAGMTDLIRPALYQAYHKIENITSVKDTKRYDVVGPICESSDTFGKALMLPETQRGDLIAIRTTGAYGEVLISQYNLRDLPKVVYSDEI